MLRIIVDGLSILAGSRLLAAFLNAPWIIIFACYQIVIEDLHNHDSCVVKPVSMMSSLILRSNSTCESHISVNTASVPRT